MLGILRLQPTNPVRTEIHRIQLGPTPLRCTEFHYDGVRKSRDLIRLRLSQIEDNPSYRWIVEKKSGPYRLERTAIHSQRPQIRRRKRARKIDDDAVRSGNNLSIRSNRAAGSLYFDFYRARRPAHHYMPDTRIGSIRRSRLFGTVSRYPAL